MKSVFYSVLVVACLQWLTGCQSQGFSAGQATPVPDYSLDYDLLFTGGTIVDGTGGEAYRADLLVKGDEISYIGFVDADRLQVKRTVDATGKVVTPGFIDTHPHGDPLVSGFQESFVLQGVTTKVMGQDGRTPGYKYRNNISMDDWWQSVDSPDVDSAYSRSLLEWTIKVEKHGVAPNIATLVGMGSIRLMSGAMVSPVPTDEQLDTMKTIIRREMDAGAYGISSGLEYVPGRYSKTEELLALAQVVGEYDGVIMSHMRTEDAGKIDGAIEELIAQGTFARVHASHIKIVTGITREEGDAVVAQINAARDAGIEITADVYPYLAGMADMTLVYPSWAKRKVEFENAAKNDRQRLETALYERVMSRNGPERILITSGDYKGKNLAEVAEILEIDFVDVLIDTFGYGGPGAAHFTQSKATHDAFILADNIAISTDGSPTTKHPRSYGSFPKVIEEYVINEPLMTLQKAIYKMTALPARATGIQDRGTLQVGKKADILVFAPQDIKANATWTEYNKPPEGFALVVVNGKVAVEQGRVSDRPHGKILRRGVN